MMLNQTFYEKIMIYYRNSEVHRKNIDIVNALSKIERLFLKYAIMFLISVSHFHVPS